MKMKIPIWYETLEWHSTTTTSHKVSQGVATVVGFTVLGKNNIPFFLSQSSVVRSQNLPTRKWNFGTPTRAFNTGPRKSPEKWFASQPASRVVVSGWEGNGAHVFQVSSQERRKWRYFPQVWSKYGAAGVLFSKHGRNEAKMAVFSPSMIALKHTWR